MLSRLKLVTFDVTDTLLKFRYSPGKQYGDVGTHYGIECDSNALSNNFKTHWVRMNNEHPNFGLHSGLGWENWWKNIVKETFKDSQYIGDIKQLDVIADHLIHMYKNPSCWQYCSGAKNLLSYIRHQSIPIGIISNFDPRLNQVLENVKLKHFFQFILTSYDVGIQKPDKKIFETAMKLSAIGDLKPNECLHVGDQFLLDYYGAKSAGWHAILIDERSPEEMKSLYPKLDTNHLFSSLHELHTHFVNTSNKSIFSQKLL